MDKHALDPACLLGDRLQTLSRAELTALAEALCRILAERGTYHGGIRPDNISRAADGTVGLGAPARTDTKDWTTEELEFMAPEVFWSGTLDASADVYSLGLLLYAGVSGGRLPFYPDDRAPLPEDQTDALRRRIREIENNKDATAVEQDLMTTLEVCYEFCLRGFHFEPINIYRSDATKFVVTENGLLPPFTSVRGLGETAALDTVEKRKGKDFTSVEEFSLCCNKLSQTHIDQLRALGAFAGLPETSQLTLF